MLRDRTTDQRLHSVRTVLDRLYLDFDSQQDVTDPIQLVHRYSDPVDQEIVGFLASGLAFGRVSSVLKSAEGLLSEMGRSPASFVREFNLRRTNRRIRELRHRWVGGHDLLALLAVLRHILETEGSIEQFFLRGYNREAEDIGSALDSFCTRVRTVDLSLIYRDLTSPQGVWYFFPKPSAGSACKRLNLFLRWMVRCDHVDCGVWSRVDRSRLVIPLDTHIVRVSQCLRLTSYRTPGWRMATEITKNLRRLDPSDPVKYDFSMCHLGMQNACGFRRSQQDQDCPLRGVCRPSYDKSKGSHQSSFRR